MFIRLTFYAATAIALLFGAEGIGLIAKNRYLPQLPRPDSAQNTPQGWASAAFSGLNQLSSWSKQAANLSQNRTAPPLSQQLAEYRNKPS